MLLRASRGHFQRSLPSQPERHLERALHPLHEVTAVVDLDDDASIRRRYGRLAGVGLQFGAAITLFALAGNWLDERTGTRPLFLVLGVMLGFAGGTISLVRAVARSG